MWEFTLTEKMRNRILTILTIMSLIVCIGLSLCQFFRYGTYKTIDISAENVLGGDEYIWSVDSLLEMSDTYQISGWIIRKQEDIQSRNICLVVANEDGSAYVVPTLMVQRTDVTEAYNGENESYNYDYSGFATSLNKKYVHSEKSKLYILYQNNGSRVLVDLAETFELD